jgi:glycine/D-amino acid oxidase-like deaminating enzyme/predicted dehydrogenase
MTTGDKRLNRKKAKKALPAILLVGSGKELGERIAIWKRLEAEGRMQLAAVAVSSPDLCSDWRSQLDVPVFLETDSAALTGIDGVDIVGYEDSLESRVRRFLPFAPVLVEHPLCLQPAAGGKLVTWAAKQRYRLTVNQPNRFHPALLHLKKLMNRDRANPRMVTVTLLDPADSPAANPLLQTEIRQPFEILDLLLGPEGEVFSSHRDDLLYLAGLRYPKSVLANVRIGKAGDKPVFSVDVEYSNKRLSVDMSCSTVLLQSRDGHDRIILGAAPEPLEASLRAFAKSLSVNNFDLAPGPSDSQRIVKLAQSAKPIRSSGRPRVAIIGGGIFGASCAIELASECDVVIFERHAELLSEATFHNQWRHHSGFHYPRSIETVREIQATRDDFHAMYGAQAIQDIVSYYCTATSAREITRERYLDACLASGLEFIHADPPSGILDPSQVNLTIRTDEGVFDFYALRDAIEDRLDSLKTVELRKKTAVTNAAWGKSGMKTLEFTRNGKVRKEPFDYVVNATYANLNLLANWLGFPVQRLRFDLCEMLLMELDLEPICLTILDGPFTSLVGTGRPKEFLLSHIHESILRSSITPDGLPPLWKPWVSNRAELLRQCSRYIPGVLSGKVLESRYATRAVRAFSEDYDGRPTVVTCHGFGCWSVLGGKIVTSVTNARTIAAQILRKDS